MTPTPTTQSAPMTLERLTELLHRATAPATYTDPLAAADVEALLTDRDHWMHEVMRLQAHLAARDEQMRQALKRLACDFRPEGAPGPTLALLGIFDAAIRAAATALGLGEL